MWKEDLKHLFRPISNSVASTIPCIVQVLSTTFIDHARRFGSNCDLLIQLFNNRAELKAWRRQYLIKKFSWVYWNHPSQSNRWKLSAFVSLFVLALVLSDGEHSNSLTQPCSRTGLERSELNSNGTFSVKCRAWRDFNCVWYYFPSFIQLENLDRWELGYISPPTHLELMETPRERYRGTCSFKNCLGHWSTIIHLLFDQGITVPVSHPGMELINHLGRDITYNFAHFHGLANDSLWHDSDTTEAWLHQIVCETNPCPAWLGHIPLRMTSDFVVPHSIVSLKYERMQHICMFTRPAKLIQAIGAVRSGWKAKGMPIPLRRLDSKATRFFAILETWTNGGIFTSVCIWRDRTLAREHNKSQF